MERQTKSILEMAHGAFLERTDYEIEKVVKNILDANTNPTAKRKMIITMTFTPDYDRKNVVVKYEVKSTLAPVNPAVTNLYVMGVNSGGVPQISEMTPQVPGQMDMFGNMQEAAPMLKIVGSEIVSSISQD